MQQRLAQVAVGGLHLIGIIAAAGFRIEQNRRDDGLHITAHAVAVIVKDLRNAADISGTGIAGDQFLDQLLADKRGHVGMIENVLQARGEISLNGAARRKSSCRSIKL